MDLANSRVQLEKVAQYTRTDAGGATTPVSSHQFAVFNGQQHKFYEPSETNQGVHISTGGAHTELRIYERAQQLLFGVEHNPLLLACGTVYLQLRIEADNLRVEIDPNRLRIDNDELIHEGRHCVVVRTVPDEYERFYEYWVDAEDPRKIVQFNGYGLQGNGELWLSTSIDYRDTEWGPIPDHWVVEKYSFQTGKARTFEVQLDEFEANPTVADADFDIEPPPGTLVFDTTRPDGDQEYVVGSSAQPNLPVGEFVLQQEQSRYRMWMYFGLAAVVVVVIAAVVVKRRREA